MLIVPDRSGPAHPRASSPPRELGSVRRTTSIDSSHPDGMSGPIEVDARARDLRTGEATWADEQRLRATLGADRVIVAVEAEPAEPRLARLVGASAGPGFRARMTELLPDHAERRTLLHTLLDDLPGASLVSGYAMQRTNPPVVPAGARAYTARHVQVAEDMCAGWASDATIVVTFRATGEIPHPIGPPAPTLERSGDPLSWHDMAPLPPESTRRRRRIDVLPPSEETGAWAFDSHFRDSYCDAEGARDCDPRVPRRRMDQRRRPASRRRAGPGARASLGGVPRRGRQCRSLGRSPAGRPSRRGAGRIRRYLHLHPSERLVPRPGRPRASPPPGRSRSGLLSLTPRAAGIPPPFTLSAMPNAPVPEPESGPPEAHHARQVAESFGSDAERYDRTRPRYPHALVERIVAASPGPDVLDVGCGTGIVARQFQAAGCRVLGVDPDPRMADFARRKGLEVEVATIETWESSGRTFDAVIAGQAWHWVDPVAGAATAADVLRPGGRLAVFWNVFQPSSDLAEAFSAVYRRVLPDSPFSRGAMPGLDELLGVLHQGGRGDRKGRRLRRPRAVALRLGPRLRPRRVAGRGADVRRSQPVPTGHAGRTAGGHRRRHRRGGG